MDIMAVRNAIVEILTPVLPGWQGYPILVDQFSPPAFMVTDVSDMDYLRAMGSGSIKFTLGIRYCVPRANEIEAHAIISRILGVGVGTPAEALQANENLLGTCDFAVLARVRRMSRYRVGSGDSYLGAEQELDIEG